MKILFSILIVFTIVFCLSACKKESDAGYTYLPETELYTQQNSSGFYREYKNTYKYDDNGNVIKKVEYAKSGMFYVREAQYDTKYTYNKNGDISQELVRIEEFSTSLTDGHHIWEEAYNYIYNENQQLVKKEIVNPSDSDDALYGYEYEYDEYGNRIKEYKCFANGTKELEFENRYDSQNKLTQKLHMENSYDFMYVWDETNYSYDTDGKLVYSKTVHYERSGETSHYYEVKYYYDKLNRLVKEEETGFDKDGKTGNNKVVEYKDFKKIED